MTPPVRLGLIGAGYWGRICLRNMVAMAPAAVVTAVASRNAETARIVPDGCRLFADWADLLDSGLCDAVVISTVVETHVPIAMAALQRGLAVFVEKPLCFDPVEARAFRAVAVDAGLPVVIDHIHLFNPPFRHLLEWADRLGPITAIQSAAGKPGLPHPGIPVLWDWGAHDVAMCVRLLRRAPDHVAAQVLARPSIDGGVGEIVGLKLKFGATDVSVTLGSLPVRKREMTVMCRDSVLLYDDVAEHKLRLNGEALPHAMQSPLALALEEFRQQVAAGAGLDREALDLGVTVVEVLAQAQKSLIDTISR
jgi:predicted dehydrogenase